MGRRRGLRLKDAEWTESLGRRRTGSCREGAGGGGAWGLCCSAPSHRRSPAPKGRSRGSVLKTGMPVTLSTGSESAFCKIRLLSLRKRPSCSGTAGNAGGLMRASARTSRGPPSSRGSSESAPWEAARGPRCAPAFHRTAGWRRWEPVRAGEKQRSLCSQAARLRARGPARRQRCPSAE